MLGGPAVHPLGGVEALALDGEAPPQDGDVNGLPTCAGTTRGWVLRALQMAAAAAVLLILASAPDFPSIITLRSASTRFL